jgi:glycosyltransferase involved in cell wall biosynthesis
MVKPKLRIAVWHNLPSGGGKRALSHHLAGLIQRGHQVEVWCPNTAALDYLPLREICPEHVLPLAAPKRLRFLSWVADYQVTQARIQAMRQHVQACAQQIQVGNFDVLLANTCAHFAVPAIGRYLEIPKVIYLQEPKRSFYEALPELMWSAPSPAADRVVAGPLQVLRSALQQQRFRLEMREESENAKHFDRILVNSLFSRESVLRAYGMESEVCGLGIDADIFHPTGQPVEKYLIGLGTISYHKGVDRAIRAVAALPKEHRLKLLWIGNEVSRAYLAELQQLARGLNVDFEVKVMVTDKELVSLLSRATAMLYTSRLEPFGLAPLEANACGTPVVAIAEGGVRESIVAGENGLLVPNAQPETIAAALLEILDNPARALALRSKCRSVVLQRWGLTAAAERLETALLDVMHRARSSSVNVTS